MLAAADEAYFLCVADIKEVTTTGIRCNPPKADFVLALEFQTHLSCRRRPDVLPITARPAGSDCAPVGRLRAHHSWRPLAWVSRFFAIYRAAFVATPTWGRADAPSFRKWAGRIPRGAISTSGITE